MCVGEGVNRLVWVFFLWAYAFIGGIPSGNNFFVQKVIWDPFLKIQCNLMFSDGWMVHPDSNRRTE